MEALVLFMIDYQYLEGQDNMEALVMMETQDMETKCMEARCMEGQDTMEALVLVMMETQYMETKCM